MKPQEKVLREDEMNSVMVVPGRNGQVWPMVLNAVRESRRENRRLVLYVPEQYTLQAERGLITGLNLPGLLDIQVVSPRKLRQQVKERMGSGARETPGETGRVMAVHRVLTEQAGALTFYRNMANLPGAVRRIREALDELDESELTDEELEACAENSATGSERAKLRDLRIVRDAYRSLITEHFDDDREAWTDMVKRLERSGLWDGADLAVYGFDSIRPDLRELLARMCGRVHSVRIFLTMDREDAPDGRIYIQQHSSITRLRQALEAAGAGLKMARQEGERPFCAAPLRFLDRNLFALSPEKWTEDIRGEIALFAGASPWEEAEHIAAALRKWHMEGIPWTGMAVALPPGAEIGSMLRANLRINGIPFTYQQKDKAAEHPLCLFLLSALSCLSDGYGSDQVITMARSGYSTLSPEEGLRLEAYALAHGTEGRKWQKPFTAGENAADAEELRNRLIAPVEELRARLRDARTASASVEALVSFLEKNRAWDRLQEQEEDLLKRELYREAVVNRQVWELLMNLLEQLWTLLGSRRAAIGDLKQMIGSALGGAEIAALPETQDGVTIGEVGHLLAGEVDALILPGVQDGVLAAPESGWLTDPERKRLESATGRTIGISREQACLIRKYDFYRTLTLPGKHLLVSWSLRNEDGGALQPDGIVEQIRTLFPKLRTEGGISGGGKTTPPVVPPATPEAALDGLGACLEDMKKGMADDLKEGWRAALIQLLYSDTYGETARMILNDAIREKAPKRIGPETARKLFMTDVLSVSRLEQYASCPYRHFLQYGIRPVRQERFDFQSNDAGSFFHEALDRYMKTAEQDPRWPDLTDGQADGLMDGILKELTEEEWKDGPLQGDAVGLWLGEGFLRRVRHAARVLTRFAANSDFRTIATEQPFGDPGGLPPVVLKLKDGTRTAIRGVIDRIDTYENGEGLWVRIVDNKSSGRKPDAARMAVGEQLQLMIYLKAAAESMPGAHMAGAFYFPVEDREVAAGADDPAAIEEARMKNVRMKGIAADDADVLRAMDRDISPYSIDRVFNRDGSVSKNADWALDEATIRRLTDAAAEKAEELCSRMRGGEIDAAPVTDGENTACRFCEYRGICRSGKENGRPLDKQATFREVAAGEQRKNTLRETEK